ncbi:hypothetical protein BSAF29S_06040 [Bacillus safensis subsp. safensis]
MKPLLYYIALQNGFTPATVMRSEETVFELDHQGSDAAYSPSNYHGYYPNDGIAQLQALALSDNIYAGKDPSIFRNGTACTCWQDIWNQGETRSSTLSCPWARLL